MFTFPKFSNIQRVSTRQRIAFSCTRCGACCKNVRDSLFLTPLDAYRLIHFLQKGGVQKPPVEALESIAERKELIRGFHIYVLKTVNDSGVCTFLKDNRCAVYAARPFTCRMYPFSPDFRADGSVDWELCLEQSHHFRGGHVTAREWQRRYLKEEDALFFIEEAKQMPLIGELLYEVPDARLHEAETWTLSFYYFAYDFSQPFLPQFQENMAFLAVKLRELQNG